MNAALILPDRAEPYMSAHENTPLSESKIVSHFVLAAGFAQSDNLDKARHYLERGNHLLQQSLLDTSLQKERYLSQAAELNTFLVYRIHGKEAAHEALQKARQWANIQWFNDAMENLRKKLDVLGQPARSLQTEHWMGADDNTDISSFRGKVVLVNFFRWSCGACNASIPPLQAIKNRFAKDDFAIVGVTDYRGQYEHEKNASQTREYELMRDHYRVQRKVDWPISMSKTGMNNYGIDRTPTYLLIDKNGLVREWDANISYSYLAERIKALVEETN
jgi:peroxiredoxin